MKDEKTPSITRTFFLMGRLGFCLAAVMNERSDDAAQYGHHPNRAEDKCIDSLLWVAPIRDFGDPIEDVHDSAAHEQGVA